MLYINVFHSLALVKIALIDQFEFKKRPRYAFLTTKNKFNLY